MEERFTLKEIMEKLSQLPQEDKVALMEYYSIGQLRTIFDQSKDSIKDYTNQILKTASAYICIYQALDHLAVIIDKTSCKNEGEK